MNRIEKQTYRSDGDTLAEVYPVQCTTPKQNKKRGKGAERGK